MTARNYPPLQLARANPRVSFRIAGIGTGGNLVGARQTAARIEIVNTLPRGRVFDFANRLQKSHFPLIPNRVK
jgi:hypothetical protein